MSTKRAVGVPARSRTSNWTSVLDESMLRILKQEHTLGNCNGGHFTHGAWARIVPAFNRQTGLTLTKDNMKNRMKVLKRTFKMYNDLATTRGWHWDPVKYLPIPREPSDWDKMIAGKPCYAKCKDKPFQAYADIKLLYAKTPTTAKQEDGVNGDRDASFSDSDDDENSQIPTANQNDKILSPIPLRFADPFPFATQNISHADASPVTDNHAQSMEHPAGTPPLSSEKQTSSSSSGSTKRRKIKSDSKALDELIELGKQRLEIAKVLLSREATVKPNLYSISQCISKLETIDGITPAAFLAACEAFKDEADRTIFMHLKGPVIKLWIERQIIKQSCYSQCLHQYHSNNLKQQQFPQ